MGISRVAEPNAAAERRSQPRMELEVEVGLETEHNFYTGLTQDISSGGLFVATSVMYRVGDQVRIRFSLPGTREPITADARVRWIRDPRAMKTDAAEGVGLQFVDLTDEARAQIGAFLAQRDSLFYDVD